MGRIPSGLLRVLGGMALLAGMLSLVLLVIQSAVGSGDSWLGLLIPPVLCFAVAIYALRASRRAPPTW